MYKPNELPITRQLAEEVLRRGYAIDKRIEFIAGPDADSRIRGCYYNPADDCLVVVFDEAIEQPIISQGPAI